jgi:hypothetical protein
MYLILSLQLKNHKNFSLVEGNGRKKLRGNALDEAI